MSPERIHEALNLLDEDMIQAVEQLRDRKCASHWPRWAALAACLAVVCALGLYQSGLLGQAESADTAAQQEQAAEPAEDDSEEYQTVEKETKPIRVESGNDLVDEAEESNVMIPLPSVLVRVDTWQDDRFTATVLQAGGTLAAGDSVTVLLTEDTTWPAGELAFEEGALVEMEFVPGPETGAVYAAILSPAE